MNKIRAILVDDEESARDVLENLLVRFCPEIELLAKCENLEQAVPVINQLNPDLVFLDIEMPDYAGYEIVNFFEEINFGIIFVTAYDQYALKAFEISAIDYLLKPIDIERLKQAVSKTIKYYNKDFQASQLGVLSQTLKTKKLNNIAVTEKGYQYIVPLEDVIAFEAQEAYCTIHTSEKKYIVSKNLKHFEVLLEDLPHFVRVHKSWIINTNYLLHYSKSEFSIQLKNNITAKLSKYKKADFETVLFG